MSDASQSSKKTGKTLPKAAEAALGWPSVRAFLLNHPNLVREDAELMEIGRASCRERVCLYV